MIRVPIQSNTAFEGKFVELNESQLPGDVQKVIQMLSQEKASIEYWLEIALMYYRKGDSSKFSHILGEALREDGFDDRIQKRHLFENEKERIKAMNVLAGHQLYMFEQEKEVDKRKQISQKGYKLIEEANTISQIDPNNLISMCFYEITAGQLKQAQSYCETCEQQIRNSLASSTKASSSHASSGAGSAVKSLCLLARAIIEFNRGHLKESLQFLKQLIMENPRAPSDIWFAMGLCYYRLGNFPKAKLSFDRTIELDPENSMALVSLGILSITQNINDFSARETAVKFFSRAFTVDPSNPLALKYLAEHYFFKGEFKLATDLSTAGIEVLKNKTRPERAELPSFRQDLDQLRSCFYFIKGKVEHAQQNFKDAFTLYEESLKHNPVNYATHFCLAKVQFHLSNYQAAEQNLSVVMRCSQFKDSHEALRMLAQIKARQSSAGTKGNNHEEALKLFRKVIELNPKDFDASFEIAALFEQSDPKQALIYYEAGIKVIRAELAQEKPSKYIEKWPGSFTDPWAHSELCKGMIPAELLNNVAVLMLESKRNDEAAVVLEEALANCDKMLNAEAGGDSEDSRVKALKITIRFNLAFCYEEAQKIGEATETLKQLIKEEPSYTDAYLRLAYLARKRGDLKRGLHYIEQAKQNHIQKASHSKPTNLYCMKGKFHADFGQVKEAVAEYRQALEISASRDCYALAGLANVQYSASVQCRSDVYKQEEFLRKAMTQYFQLLGMDENNCLGVLGIGNILAEYGKNDEAKEIFKLLSTSVPDSLIGQHAMLNQAHLLMAEESYEFSVNLYQTCLEKQPESLEIAMFLSKAFYKKKDYDSCKKLTIRLISKYPQDLRLKYNLAYCLYQEANEVFNLNTRRVSQTRKAIQSLQSAKTLLCQFIKCHQKSGGQQHQFFYPSNTKRELLELVHRTFHDMYKVAEETMTYLNSMLQNAEYYLQHDQERENDQLKAQQEREQVLEDQRLKEQQEQDKLREEALQRRQAATEQFKQLQENLGELDLTIVKNKGGKRARQDTADFQNQDHDGAGDGGADWLENDNEGLPYDEASNEFNSQPAEFKSGESSRDVAPDGSADGDFAVADGASKKPKKSGDKRKRDKKEKKEKKDKKEKKRERRLKKNKEGGVTEADVPAGNPVETKVETQVETKVDEEQPVKVEAAPVAVGAAESSDDEGIGMKRKRRVRKTAEIEDEANAGKAHASSDDSGLEKMGEPTKRQKTSDE